MGFYILWAILAAILIFVLVLLINAVIVGKKKEKIEERPVWHSEEEQLRYAQRLKKMIECQTVSSKDGFDSTEFMKLRAVMKELFPLIHEKGTVEYFSDDCWVYKVEGEDTSRNILVMSHHDVVAATGEWTHEKFGEIADGAIWGRGTVDTKGPLFAEFSALEELLEEGFKPKCNVYIASGHNEEIFGDGIKTAVEHFLKEGIEFEVALDEGGGVIAPPLAGINCKCAMMAVHEKGYHTLKASAKQGDSKVGALIEGPILRMSKFIAECNKAKLIRKMAPQLEAMFKSLAPYMAFPMRIVFGNLWCFKGLLVKIIPMVSSQAAAMLGTTMNFNNFEFIKGDSPRDNECRASALVRFIDEDDLRADMAEIRKIADKYGIEIEEPEEEHEYHRGADLSLPPYEYVRKCAREVFPHAAPAPFILAAGTDARWMNEVCPCTIRFAPIDINDQQLGSVHSPDENMHLTAVSAAVKFYKTFIKNYK